MQQDNFIPELASGQEEICAKEKKRNFVSQTYSDELAEWYFEVGAR